MGGTDGLEVLKICCSRTSAPAATSREHTSRERRCRGEIPHVPRPGLRHAPKQPASPPRVPNHNFTVEVVRSFPWGSDLMAPRSGRPDATSRAHGRAARASIVCRDPLWGPKWPAVGVPVGHVFPHAAAARSSHSSSSPAACDTTFGNCQIGC